MAVAHRTACVLNPVSRDSSCPRPSAAICTKLGHVHEGAVRLKQLTLENIGPFESVELDLTADDGAPPVVILTGENGTGKSVVLDAIRQMFGPLYGTELRRLPSSDEFRARLVCQEREQEHDFSAMHLEKGLFDPTRPTLFHADWLEDGGPGPGWLVAYWTSGLATDSFEIKQFQTPTLRQYLSDAFSGTTRNAEATSLVCYIDYLRDSRDPAEQAAGKFLWDAVERVVQIAIPDGRLLHVARGRLEPVFEVSGHQVAMDQLSAGSLYVLQRLLDLVMKAYAAHQLADDANRADDLYGVPGVLLIDEAENHLHPKLQKRLLPSVREMFPNIQIIVATHSPFIVGSIPGAKVLLCRRTEAGPSEVVDVSEAYSLLPVDEILASAAFAGTVAFSGQIETLLAERKKAYAANNLEEAQRIERELIDLNRDYFQFYELDKLIRKVAG